MTTAPSRPHRVYLASSRAQFGSATLEAAARAVARRFPGADIVRPEHLFADSRDWRLRWPTVLASLDALVFVTLADDWIGHGTATEIQMADARGLPLWLARTDGQVLAVASPRFGDPNAENWQRYCRIHVDVAGRPAGIP